MSTLAEIKAAICQLAPSERALLAAEFPALEEPSIDDPRLHAALLRGLADVKAGRVQTVDDVRAEVSKWVTKS